MLKLVFLPIVELQFYNISIFGNMYAVCLAALQYFFSHGSTGDTSGRADFLSLSGGCRRNESLHQ